MNLLDNGPLAGLCNNDAGVLAVATAMVLLALAIATRDELSDRPMTLGLPVVHLLVAATLVALAFITDKLQTPGSWVNQTFSSGASSVALVLFVVAACVLVLAFAFASAKSFTMRLAWLFVGLVFLAVLGQIMVVVGLGTLGPVTVMWLAPWIWGFATVVGLAFGFRLLQAEAD